MLAAPKTQRESLNLLTRVSEMGTIESVLDLVNWTGVTPTQIYQSILGRMPEDAGYAIPDEHYSAKDHFLQIIRSEEFQRGIINTFLRHCPSGKRVIFVHIPKCAGTDLIYNLAAYFPHLALSHSLPEWTTPDELILQLAKTMIRKISCNNILISGHFSLGFALNNYYRFGDEVFTIIREPRSIVISQVNYVLDTLRTDVSIGRPDTRMWWEKLNRPALAIDAQDQDWRNLALDLLHNQEIIDSNPLCFYLGSGSWESAVETLASAPVEIVDIHSYDAWLAERWGIRPNSRQNVGHPFLDWHKLSPDDKSHIDTISNEDRTLFNLIARANQGGLLSSVTCNDLWYKMARVARTTLLAPGIGA